MGHLNILIADDQKREVENARLVLKDMAHHVFDFYTYDEALDAAKSNRFDIAVVDLGWYSDSVLVDRVGKENASTAGWKILDSLKLTNPNTIRILYSNRANDPNIARKAATEKIISIKKDFSNERRVLLADIVRVIAQQLSIESQLRNRIQTMQGTIDKLINELDNLHENINKQDEEQKNKLEIDLIAAQSEIDRLLKQTDSKSVEIKKFARIILASLILPTFAFLLFILSWLLTNDVYIGIVSFVFGSFLILIILRATGSLTIDDIKEFKSILNSLSPKGS